MMHSDNPFRTWLRWSLAIAAVGAVLCAIVSWGAPSRLWQAYLAGYMLVWPITLGAAGLLAIGNLTGGRWALASRPLHLAVTRTIPLVALLFIPIALNVEQIYPWATESSGGEHPLPPSKAAYLEPTFFLWRAAGYIAVWLVVIGLLNWVSQSPQPPASTPGMRRVGALSLVLLAPTATFAAFDWGMSLEPEWYSSIYGAIVIAAGVLAAHALVVCSLVAAGSGADFVGIAAAAEESHHDKSVSELATQIYNDLGNLMLAFVMVFGYFAFSQFMIIWSANLPSEITWYLRRLNGGWQWPGLLMVFLLFAAFFQLLSRDRKRSPDHLRMVATFLLVAYAFHTFWVIVPAFPQSGAPWLLTNVAAFAALGGIWWLTYSWLAGRAYETHRTEPPANAVG